MTLFQGIFRAYLRRAGLIIFFATGTAAFAAPPTAYDFSKPSSFTDVELSPNGQYLAYLMVDNQKYCFDDDGQMVALDRSECSDDYKRYRNTHIIKIYDLQNSKIVNTIPVPRNFLIDWLEWASDDRLLASLRSPTTYGRKGRGAQRGAARVVSFPRVGGNLTPLFDGQGTMVRQNRNMARISNLLRRDPEHIMMPAKRDTDLDLFKVNVVTGKAELVEEGKADTFYWFTNEEGKPILRYDCAGNRCRRIKIFAPDSTGNWNQIKTFNIKPDEWTSEFPFWPVAPSETPGQYYVISQEDDAPRRTIKIYDFKTNAYVKTVFEHPEYDVGWSVPDHQTGAYAGAWYYKDRKTYALIDEKRQKHIEALHAYFSDKENISILGYNADGTQLVMFVDAVNNPGEYYIYDFAAQKVELLFRIAPELGDRLPSNTDILTIPARDGTPITAYHSYPAGSPKGAPMIIRPHGGPEGRDRYDYYSEIQYFVSRGYQVLQINFRGSSGYGKDFAEAGYGQWGGLMQDDLTDAVKYTYEKGIASAENTCIVGYSYGGYAALYGGAKTPELYKCVVSGGGVSDLTAFVKRVKVDDGSKSAALEYWEESIGDLSDDKDKIKAASPINLADGFTAPVLLVHGEFDGTVHVSQSEDMEKALKKARKNVEYFELEDAGHNGWDIETQIEYIDTVEAFLKKHLK